MINLKSWLHGLFTTHKTKTRKKRVFLTDTEKTVCKVLVNVKRAKRKDVCKTYNISKSCLCRILKEK